MANPKKNVEGGLCSKGHLLVEENIRRERNNTRIRCRRCDNIRHGRGDVISKIRERKTHCVNGHEFTEANIYWVNNHRSCRACRKENQRKQRPIQKYGLTWEQLDVKVEEQGGCGVCKRPLSRKEYQVDHDHSCCPEEKTCGLCVRGVVCSLCNKGLGNFKDNIQLLRAAIEYIEKYTNN